MKWKIRIADFGVQFTKTLQHTDAHEKGSDYVERLREEVPLYSLVVKSQILFERESWSDQVARAIMRRLDHVYSKVCLCVSVCTNCSDIRFHTARLHHRPL